MKKFFNKKLIEIILSYRDKDKNAYMSKNAESILKTKEFENLLKVKAYEHLGSRTYWKYFLNMFLAQGGCCSHSGVPFSLENISIEHKNPIGKGGVNKNDLKLGKCTFEQLLENLCLCDYTVNMMKHDMTEQEFKDYLHDLAYNHYEYIIKNCSESVTVESSISAKNGDYNVEVPM